MNRVPLATYRLQFNRQFTFRDATAVAEYLDELGVSDCYASPLFEAAPNSTHGYDVCSYANVNPQLGTIEDFDHFTSRLHELGLGLVLDIVPNHMSASPTNAWWIDVLQHGRNSQYASFFDVDWEVEDKSLRGKILLPILEDHYETVLEYGKLRLEFDRGCFSVRYHDRAFPVAPETLPSDASANPQQTTSAFNGQPGNSHSFHRLHALLEQQHYRLADWRLGSTQINYRRFFDVVELVGLRMDHRDVFRATHELIKQWLREGKVTGLRIDHPDGLADPKEYLERLQELASNATNGAHHKLFVVVEKILSKGESLPNDWPVHGSTGYDFLNRVNGLFVNQTHAATLDQVYRNFTGSADSFERVVYRGKKRVLAKHFKSELTTLSRQLLRIAAPLLPRLQLSPEELETALTELIIAFPVYRTYITRDTVEPSASDRAAIQSALDAVKSRNAACNPAALEFISKILLLLPIPELDAQSAECAREFILRFQQLTGPVAAKGVEDTAFYNYNRLLSLNEVGGDPSALGTTIEEFHHGNSTTSKTWPHTLLATETHDTKRGEDARARLNVLSEIPIEWQHAITRWTHFNADHKTIVRGRAAPSAADEYFLYQSLIGAWPLDPNEATHRTAFRERAVAFMLKAVRESKANTSWLDPDADYERAVDLFVTRILASSPFIDDFKAFCDRVSYFAQFNSLAQTLLKATSPGVPDFYQGSELWDFSFVDPDNRHPVDFKLRHRLLAELRDQLSQHNDDPASTKGWISELQRRWPSGEVKLYLIWRALELRRRRRELFDDGAYVPLSVFGVKREHACAFARQLGSQQTISIAPRLVVGLTNGSERPPIGRDVWQDTALSIPNTRAGDFFRNVFTNERIAVREHYGRPVLMMSEVLGTFPVALLERV